MRESGCIRRSLGCRSGMISRKCKITQITSANMPHVARFKNQRDSSTLLKEEGLPGRSLIVRLSMLGEVDELGEMRFPRAKIGPRMEGLRCETAVPLSSTTGLLGVQKSAASRTSPSQISIFRLSRCGCEHSGCNGGRRKGNTPTDEFEEGAPSKLRSTI